MYRLDSLVVQQLDLVHNLQIHGSLTIDKLTVLM